MKVTNVFALAIFTLFVGAGLGYRFGANHELERNSEDIRESGSVLAEESAGKDEFKETLVVEVPVGIEHRTFEARAREALAFKSNRKQAYEIERLFEDLRVSEAPALLARMLEWPDSQERRGMLRPFFLKWGELEGPAALEAAESLLGRDKSDALSAAYAGWAASDPHAAWEKAEVYLEDASPYSAYTLRGVMAELAKADMEKALAVVSAEANDIKSRGLSSSMLVGVFDSGRVSEFVDKIGALENQEVKKNLLNAVFSRWGADDSAGPMAAIAKMDDPESASQAMSGFLAGWADEDREGAIRFALDNREDPLISNSLGDMLRNAVMRGGNRENAQLLADVESAGVFDKVAKELVGAASFANPGFALEIAERVSDAEDRTRYQQMAMSNFARMDLGGAISYFKEKISAEDRGEVLTSISWQLERSDDGGATLVDLYHQLPEGRDRGKAVESLLERAVNPFAKSSDEYLNSLEAISREQDDLSEDALKNREKLFGPRG